MQQGPIYELEEKAGEEKAGEGKAGEGKAALTVS